MDTIEYLEDELRKSFEAILDIIDYTEWSNNVAKQILEEEYE